MAFSFGSTSTANKPLFGAPTTTSAGTGLFGGFGSTTSTAPTGTGKVDLVFTSIIAHRHIGTRTLENVVMLVPQAPFTHVYCIENVGKQSLFTYLCIVEQKLVRLVTCLINSKLQIRKTPWAGAILGAQLCRSTADFLHSPRTIFSMILSRSTGWQQL